MRRLRHLSLLLGAARGSAISLDAPARPPMTLLGGFLGTGKTTTLTHLLTNRDGLRIAVLVNDVAAVNVDAMSLRRTAVQGGGDIEMVQLENGCVCCSAAGDLVPAVAALLERNDPFDHVVIELSGVADPMNVQKSLGLGGIEVNRKVALVDANAFPVLYGSVQKAGEREDLTGPHAHEDAHACVVERPVAELLLQQIEAADVILANKCDLATDEELQTTLNACRALNAKAAIVMTTFGNAQLSDVLPRRSAASAAVPERGVTKEYALMLNGINCGGCGKAVREALMAVDGVTEVLAQSKADSGGHPNKVRVRCSCSEAAVVQAIANLDAGRGKFTIAQPGTAEEYEEFACSPPPRATVPNSLGELGVATYVYRARRPFNHQRLVELLERWPLPSKVLRLERLGKQAAVEAEPVTPGRISAFSGVLRSKGTAWLDQEPRFAATWSHAGRHFRLNYGGVWWAMLPEPVMMQCLPKPEEFAAERALFHREDGDRRQEIVFIGTQVNDENIAAALDACLCTDEELRAYRARWAPEERRLALEAGPFRFDVGARVECNQGPRWSSGAVVAHYYREPGWAPEEWTPYQVKLDDGDLIYAPADVDECIRAEPAPHPGDRSECDHFA
uniref:CobW C-terminal domain-containing protein n=1 Tax=Calcidiscus leptoporus TaxID=127549 RepID=A0A7S0IXX5_9EUKA|mmetsp:Transcript_28787/g.67506  ORF Transcript_28787/g.67506 Transcript_28787/m.67506 type:complete len:620 (+) Transcript_28787:109-1968(+)